MQKAHRFSLVGERAGLYDRAAEDLGQPASDRVDDDARKDARRGVGNEVGYECEGRKAEGRRDLRCYDARSVSEPVRDLYAGEIDCQLSDEEHDGYQGKLGQRYPVRPVKRQK